MFKERSSPPLLPTYHVLVIAHPDDESMFFVPTIRSLVQDPTNNIVWLVCLTTGNYDGLGKIRIAELKRASALLGISKVIIVDDDETIPDHPTKRWNKDHVSSILQSTLHEHIALAEQEKNNATEGHGLLQRNPKIRQCRVVLITFDDFGVSGHVNHKDTYIAVLDWTMKQLILGSSGSSSVEDGDDNDATTTTNSVQLLMEAWQLESERNLLQKYIPLQEWGLFLWYIWMVSVGIGSSYTNPDWTTLTTTTTITSTVTIRCHQPWLNWKAMATHASQWVWYRRLFVVFSCFTFCNKLRPMIRVTQQPLRHREQVGEAFVEKTSSSSRSKDD
jgi:LmbE family N-acetylglucosaminyl deacetylase